MSINEKSRIHNRRETVKHNDILLGGMRYEDERILLIVFVSINQYYSILTRILQLALLDGLQGVGGDLFGRGWGGGRIRGRRGCG